MLSLRIAAWLAGLWLLLPLPPAAASDFDHAHAAWTALLERQVHWVDGGHASVVDYAGFQRERSALAEYTRALAALERRTFDGWTRAQRQAFLINAYNALTVELILGAWPELRSIKDLGGLFRSPWSRREFALLGERRSLDDIEHGLLRGAADYAEPRIHFAVNCASVGCPALRPQAYTAAALDTQLQDQAQRFLSDRSRNRFDPGARILHLSKIFDWYAADFGGDAGLLTFLAGYADALGLDAQAVRELRAGDIDIEFGDYDWTLNAQR